MHRGSASYPSSCSYFVLPGLESCLSTFQPIRQQKGKGKKKKKGKKEKQKVERVSGSCTTFARRSLPPLASFGASTDMTRSVATASSTLWSAWSNGGAIRRPMSGLYPRGNDRYNGERYKSKRNSGHASRAWGWEGETKDMLTVRRGREEATSVMIQDVALL